MATIRDSATPSFLIPVDGGAINVTITGTDALLNEQGYTYNQAGFSYNQANWAYGGIYNQGEDITPLILEAENIYPSIVTVSDLYTNNTPPPPNFQKPVGPGWFLYVSQ